MRRTNTTHLIGDDISFSAGRVSCICGWRVDLPGISPEELNERHQAHRVSVNLARRSLFETYANRESPWHFADGGKVA